MINTRRRVIYEVALYKRLRCSPKLMIVGEKIVSENKLQSFKETLSPNLVSNVLHKQVRTMVGGYVGGGIEHTGN